MGPEISIFLLIAALCALALATMANNPENPPARLRMLLRMNDICVPATIRSPEGKVLGFRTQFCPAEEQVQEEAATPSTRPLCPCTRMEMVPLPTLFDWMLRLLAAPPTVGERIWVKSPSSIRKDPGSWSWRRSIGRSDGDGEGIRGHKPPGDALILLHHRCPILPVGNDREVPQLSLGCMPEVEDVELQHVGLSPAVAPGVLEDLEDNSPAPRVRAEQAHVRRPDGSDLGDGGGRRGRGGAVQIVYLEQGRKGDLDHRAGGESPANVELDPEEGGTEAAGEDDDAVHVDGLADDGDLVGEEEGNVDAVLGASPEVSDVGDGERDVETFREVILASSEESEEQLLPVYPVQSDVTVEAPQAVAAGGARNVGGGREADAEAVGHADVDDGIGRDVSYCGEVHSDEILLAGEDVRV
eukprot:762428-Hanusia_phi.AAC.6